MCLLCIEVAKGSMTPKEVANAYRELEVDEFHFIELISEIHDHYDINEVLDHLNKLAEAEIHG